ncbi:D-alanine--D-alanine ligase family protein [Pseudolysinimonas kribbensis]|uniref:D-alanine--D-alanine ligase family protein n=1 Tax=Pseudolysinimonas kribbensis TaxID=433641 RepID=UPI0031D8728B
MPTPPRTRVALFFGGRSSEHAISCATAGGVLGAMDPERYEVVPVGITPDGAMTLRAADEVAAFSLDELPRLADNGTRVRLPESAASRELTVQEGGAVRSLGEIDVAFPILHGPFGEDGTIQGAFELVGMPYVGNGVLASALGMDKHFTKTVLEGAGIEVAPWATVTRAELARHPELWRRRMEGLGLPVFVKPARAGSSVGVTRVTDWPQLDAALEVAFAEDSRVLVEQAVVGRELECGVLEGRDGSPPRVSVAGEIAITGRDFYDFDAKYRGADGIRLICPADLREQELERMQQIAARAFEAIGGAGLARVDFFFTGTGFVVNEINTMPGFTPISMFPSCWLASGLSYPELIDELIALGIGALR